MFSAVVHGKLSFFDLRNLPALNARGAHLPFLLSKGRDTKRKVVKCSEQNGCKWLNVNDRFFLAPADGDMDFKELFRSVSSAGAGRPVDKDGLPLGPWTADLLVQEISDLDPAGTGVDLRTVQLWFQDNDRGISADNLRLLARIFGCGDAAATSRWQRELAASVRRLTAKRRMRRTPASDPLPVVDPVMPMADHVEDTFSQKPRRRYRSAAFAEALFSGPSLNTPSLVLFGAITLAFLSYIFNVHSVTYSPAPGIEKQVGYFWAPNWTVLNLVLLPIYAFSIVGLLDYWRLTARPSLTAYSSGDVPSEDWTDAAGAFNQSFVTVAVVSFGIVFLLQWLGVYYVAQKTGNITSMMVDWNLAAIVRPDLISRPNQMVLTFAAFFYTGFCVFIYLTGMTFIYIVSQDYLRRVKSVQPLDDAASRTLIEAIGFDLAEQIFRSVLLGLLMILCIRLQTIYLLIDEENILRWLMKDAAAAVTGTGSSTQWLNNRALALFSSLLLLLATLAVFATAFARIRAVRSHLISSAGAYRSTLQLWPYYGAVLTLAACFFAIGAFMGFSLLLGLAVIGSGLWLLKPHH